MTTQFLGTSPTAVLGNKQYYRITFDVSRQVLFGTASAKLNHIYDHMQDTGALAPLSPNPVGAGDDVMVVDAWSLLSGASLSVAEAVRRLEMVASSGGYSSVRSIQKLSGIGAVAGGAEDRDQVADDTNKQNDENSLGSKLEAFFGGLGSFATLGVIGLVAYAVIVASPALSAFGRRK